MQETTVIFKDDAQLRLFLSMGLYIPNLIIYGKITKEFADGKCPSELGDGRKNVRSQYLCEDRELETWVVVGRNEINSLGTATGNYMAVDPDEQAAWVEYLGLENIFLNKPEVTV